MAGIGRSVFRFVARATMNRDFRNEYLTEILEALDRRHSDHVAKGANVLQRLTFWIREIASLLSNAMADRRADARSFTRDRPKGKETMAILQEIRLALRTIRRTPIVNGVSVASLSIGIAANVAIFALFNSWLLRPLNYPEADQLTMLWESNTTTGGTQLNLSPANYFAYREQTSSWIDLAAVSFSTRDMTGTDNPERLSVATVTPNFFSVLGNQPMQGRVFNSSLSDAALYSSVVISEYLWRDRFGAQDNVIGSTIALDGETHTIVGVMPESFDFFSGGVSVWIPLDLRDSRADRSSRPLIAFGRLRDPDRLAAAEEEAQAVSRELQVEFPESNRSRVADLVPLRLQFPADTDRRFSQVLMIVCVLVFLVAAFNVANLMLARADSRLREMAVRTSLGATRKSIIRLMLVESLVLATIAGILGTGLGWLGMNGLAGTIPPQLPSIYHPQFTPAVVVYAATLALVAALTFGLPPASHVLTQIGRQRINDWSRGDVGGSKATRRLRNSFVVIQFSAALAILVGAATFVDLMPRRLGIDPGFAAQGILTADVTLPEYRYGEYDTRRAFALNLSNSLESRGLNQHTLVSTLPRTMDLPGASFRIAGDDTPQEQLPVARYVVADPSYRETMEIELISGRWFSTTDREDSPLVVVVNERLVDRHLGDDVIGRRINILGEEREIVGVVTDVAQHRLAGVMPIDPQVYLPYEQYPVRDFHILTKAASNPLAMTAQLRAAVREVDPELPVSSVQALEDYIEFQVSAPLMIGNLMLGIGLLALGLACLGVYGVLAYNVAQRTQEIGVRMALGARPTKVLGRFLAQGSVMTGIGLVLGAPVAFLIFRAINGILSNNTDGFVVEGGIRIGPILLSITALIVIAVVACLLPARRATLVDPVEALRAE